MSKEMKIYALGYGRLSFEDFLEILKEKGIKIVIDVRRFPTSKIPDFCKERLSEKLKEFGIAYAHIEELGGFRGGYERHMKSEEFKKGMRKLKKLAERKTSVIICVEENPAWCHRRYIAKELKREGWEVIHIKPRRLARSKSH
ncbi:MAG: DUF488 domain-containing protein [Candidatus Hadarchaeales archaeon]